MNMDVSPQSPQLAHARSLLATAAITGAHAQPRDINDLDFTDALAILAGVHPPLPLPVPLEAGQVATRDDAVAALREAIAVATDLDEALRLSDATRTLTASSLA